MTADEVNARWESVTLAERKRFMVYGSKPAPDEAPPDYAARILKFDPKITLRNADRLVSIFRAAYNDLVSA